MLFKLEPVKLDKHGKNIADYKVRDFYEKLAEELFEAHREALVGEFCSDDRAKERVAATNEALELIDLMTVCATRLAALPLNEAEVRNLQAFVFAHNRDRGYFET